MSRNNLSGIDTRAEGLNINPVWDCNDPLALNTTDLKDWHETRGYWNHDMCTLFDPVLALSEHPDKASISYYPEGDCIFDPHVTDLEYESRSPEATHYRADQRKSRRRRCHKYQIWTSPSEANTECFNHEQHESNRSQQQRPVIAGWTPQTNDAWPLSLATSIVLIRSERKARHITHAACYHCYAVAVRN